MKILLIDDHSLFRAGMRLLLASIDRSAQIVEAGSLADALRQVSAHPDLDLCLLDLGLKDEDGFDGIGRIKQVLPDITVVVVSATDEVTIVHRCIDAGAMSYIPKSAEPDTLREALREALDGNVYLPPNVLAAAQMDATTANDAPPADGAPPQPTSAPAQPPAPHLTPRQIDVLRGLCRGLPNKLICSELNLSENTVKEHITTIFRALHVRNRTQAVIKAGQLGLRLKA